MKNILVFFVFVLFTTSLSAQNKGALLKGAQASELIEQAEQLVLDESNNPKRIAFKKGVTFQGAENVNNLLGSGSELSYKVNSRTKDNLGMEHLRLSTIFEGYEVLGRDFILHMKGAEVISANGNMMTGLSGINTRINLSEDEALQLALKSVGASEYIWEDKNVEDLKLREGLETLSPQGKLYLSSINYLATAPLQLVYQFDIYATSPLGRYTVEVSAVTGEIINKINNIHNHVADVDGTGETLYDGTVTIQIDEVSSTSYRMSDNTRGGGIRTYDLDNGTSYGAADIFEESDNHFDEANSRAGVSAHFGAGATYDYFLNNFGRNSYDGAGATINSYVHYSTNYFNAFWDGSRMTYGDGDGVRATALVSLDIVGHEIAHAVTQHSANLVYSYESGALNESFSDIFGQAIEFETFPATASWNLADQIYLDGVSMIRSMSNPNTQGHPDTYLGDLWYSGSGDNGGVHFNSGVQNFWFYLLVEGGSGTNDIGYSFDVPGIGLEAAQQIAYRNLTVYLTRNSQYVDARSGAESSAIDLYGYGSAEHLAVVEAWNAVGVPSTEPTINVASTLAFGPVVEATAIDKTLSVSNTGLSNLSVFDINIDNPLFTVTDTAFTVVSSGDYPLAVTFAPVDLGDESATMTIYSNADTVDVTLLGSGVVGPTYTISDSELDFEIPVDGSASSSITVTNTSDYAVDFTFESIAGEESRSFSSYSPTGNFVQVGKASLPEYTAVSSFGLAGRDTVSGYSWRDSDEGVAFDWLDISSTGTAVSLSDDSNSGLLDLGFEIEFFENTFNSVAFSSNGWLSFTNTSGSIWTAPLPSGSAPENVIALMAHDLYPTGTSHYYYDPAGRRFVVQFTNWSDYSSRTGDYTMQVQIHENGRIYLLYQTIVNPVPGTVGIQNDARNQGVTISSGDSGFFRDNYAIEISNRPVWLQTNPTALTVEPGATQSLDVLVDGAGLLGGTYDGELVVGIPAFQYYQDTVSVTLNVTGSPNIEPLPTSIDYGNLFVGDTAVFDVLINNTGNDYLIIDSIYFSVAEAYFSDSVSMSLAPLTSQQLRINFNPKSIADFNDILFLSTNDPDQALVQVDLTGSGVEAPVMTVSPESLSADLNSGETATQILTIDNTEGGSDLIWSSNLSTSGSSSFLYDRFQGQSLVQVEDQYDNNEGVGRQAPIPLNEINSLTGDVRILSWVTYADMGREYPNTMAAISQYFTDFTVETTTETDASALADLLASTDVFLIPEQELGGSLSLFYDLGEAWKDVLTTFVSDGGSVIFCGSSTGTYNLFNGSMLWDIESIAGGSGTMDVADSDHPIIEGLPETILAQNATVFLNSSDSEMETLVSNSNGVAVAVHEVDRGNIIYVGYDFFDYDDAAARIISNAVTYSGNAAWLSLNVDAGTIPAGTSTEIEVTFDANGLFGGTYEGDINIYGNDPLNPQVSVPVTLTVTGVPDINASGVALDFGDVFLGQDDTLPITIYNEGTDLLDITDITFSDPVFSADIAPFSLAYGDSLEIQLVYTPVSTEATTATISFVSNDPDEPSFEVNLTGQGLEPPVIDVTPGSLSLDLNSGETTTEILTIDNSAGGSSLNWNINLTTDGGASILYNAFQGKAAASTIDQYNKNEGVGRQAPIPLNEINSLTGDVRILSWVTYADMGREYPNTMAAISQYFTDFTVETTTETDASALADLLASTDVFLIPEQESGGSSSLFYNLGEAWKDVLTSFISNGGSVILCGSPYTYNIFNGSTLWDIESLSGGGATMNVADSDHPIIEGLPETILAQNATTFINSSDPEMEILVSSGDVASVAVHALDRGNMIYVGYDFYNYDDDAARIIANAVSLSGGGSWFDVEVASGSIEAGSSTDINVLFDAENLFGGLYEGSINITSNDPEASEISVPVSLTVTGVPEISSSETSLDFGVVLIGASETKSTVFTNDGTDTLRVSDITFVESGFEASITSFDLAPRASQEVSFVYRPTLASSISSTVSIISNDPDQASLELILEATGLEAPVLAVSPGSLSVDLNTGETATETLTIDNSAGGSDLIVEYGVNYTSEGLIGFGASTQMLSSVEAHTKTPVKARKIQGTGDETARILVIQDTEAWSLNMFSFISTNYGLTPDVIGYSDIATTDLSIYDLVITVGDQSTNYYNEVSARKEQFESYVLGGGTLQYQVATQGPDVTLAGDVVSQFGVLENTNDVVLDHPITAGLPDELLGTHANHNVILNLPENSAVLTRTRNSEEPTTVVYQLGGGTVIATGMTIEHGYYTGQNFGPMLSSMFAFALEQRKFWLSTERISDVIPAGESVELEVVFDATGLFGGVYEGSIDVISNDPTNPLLSVPVTLTVTGVPDIESSQASLDFGSIFIDSSDTLTTVIANTGTDILDVTEIVLSDAVFAADTSTFSLEPGESLEVQIIYTPVAAVVSNATASFISNDPDQPSFELNLVGEGLLPPVMVVSPESLSADLFTGETSTQVLTIDNTAGGSDLVWNADVRFNRGFSALYQTYEGQTSTITKDQYDTNEGVGRQTPIPMSEMTSMAGEVRILSLVTYADMSREYPNTLAAISQYFTDYTVNTTTETDATALAALLEETDVFLIPEQEGGSNSYFNNLGTAWSDVLDDFISNGGTVILCGSSYAYELFNGSALWPMTLVNVMSTGLDMEVSDTDHPIIDGVPDIIKSQDATFIMNIGTEGEILVGTSEAAVAVNERGSGRMIYLGYDFFDYDDDAARIIANSVAGSGIGSWLSMEVDSGTVPAGSSVDVNVNFDAADLIGGVYEGTIDVSGNDPVTPGISVPLTLTVTGAPDIASSEESLDFGELFVGGTRTLSTLISNDGTDTLHVTDVAFSDVDFTADTTAFILLPRESVEVDLFYTPVYEGGKTATVWFISNDPDQDSLAVSLAGNALIAPVITVDPGSLSASLSQGTRATQQLLIDNSEGGSELTAQVLIDYVAGFNTVSSAQVGFYSKRDPSSTGSQSLPDISQDILGDELGSLPDFPLRSTGATRVGDFLYIVDWAGDRLEKYSLTDSTIVSGFNIHDLPYGVVYDGNYFWIGDNNGIVRGYDVDGNLVGDFDLPSASYNGMTYNGQYLLVSDAFESHSLYEVNQEGEVITTIPEVGERPYQFAYDNGTYWWLGADPRTIKSFVIEEGEVSFKESFETSVTSSTYTLFHMRSAIGVANFSGQAFLYEDGTSSNWLSVDPLSVTVPAGESMLIDVTFDSEGLEIGDYEAFIRLNSNDPVTSYLSVPVSLSINSFPDISISQSSLNFGYVYLDYTDSIDVTIENHGATGVDLNLSLSGDSDFSSSASELSIPAGGTENLRFFFEPSEENTFSGIVSITTDDEAHGVIELDMSGEGRIAPVMEIDASSMTDSLHVSNSYQGIIAFENTGGSELQIDMSHEQTEGATLVSLSTDQLIIDSGNTGEVSVVFEPIGTGTYSGTLNITSNDPDVSNHEIVWSVVVYNNLPVLDTPFQDTVLNIVDGVPLQLNPLEHLSDPDGDELTFAFNYDSDLLQMSHEGDIYSLMPLTTGVSEVELITSDGFSELTQTFNVTVIQDYDPVLDKPLEDVELNATLDILEINLDEYFSEPDGEDLTFSVITGDMLTYDIEDGILKMYPQSLGTEAVEIIASDGDDEVADTFDVTIVNVVPQIIKTFDDTEINVNTETMLLDMTEYFTDEEGAEMTFVVETDMSISSVVSGNELVLTPLIPESGTVTIIASDGFDTVSGSFDLSIVNLLPSLTKTFEDLVMAPDDEVILNLEEYFTDADGGDMTFEVLASNATAVSATISGSTLTVVGLDQGVSNLTVTAKDPFGSITSDFSAEVANVTSIEEEQVPPFSLYPNPVTDGIVWVDSEGLFEKSQIVIYDTSGKPVRFTMEAVGALYKLGIDYGNSGLLFMKVNFRNGTSLYRKLILVK